MRVDRFARFLRAAALSLLAMLFLSSPSKATAIDDLKACIAAPSTIAQAGQQITEELNNPQFQQCSAQLTGGDVVMAAAMAAITGLWVNDNNLFHNATECQNKLGEIATKGLATLLLALINDAAPDVKKQITDVLGADAMKWLEQAATEEGAKALGNLASQIPAPILLYLNCGCAVAGTVAKVAELVGNVENAADPCKKIASNPAQLFEDFGKDPAGTAVAVIGLYCNAVTSGACDKIWGGIKDVAEFFSDACDFFGLCGELSGPKWGFTYDCAPGLMTWVKTYQPPPPGTPQGFNTKFDVKWLPPSCACRNGSKLVTLESGGQKRSYCGCPPGQGYQKGKQTTVTGPDGKSYGANQEYFCGACLKHSAATLYGGCLSCEPGFGAVLDICVKCPAGSATLENGVCGKCPAGQGIYNGRCSTCPEPKYSDWISATGQVFGNQVFVNFLDNGTCKGELCRCGKGDKPVVNATTGKCSCESVCQPGHVFEDKTKTGTSANALMNPAYCEMCPANTRATHGSTGYTLASTTQNRGDSCIKCSDTSYSPAGSTECVELKCDPNKEFAANHMCNPCKGPAGQCLQQTNVPRPERQKSDLQKVIRAPCAGGLQRAPNGDCVPPQVKQKRLPKEEPVLQSPALVLPGTGPGSTAPGFNQQQRQR